jgi:hypothetical protein
LLFWRRNSTDDDFDLLAIGDAGVAGQLDRSPMNDPRQD